MRKSLLCLFLIILLVGCGKEEASVQLQKIDTFYKRMYELDENRNNTLENFLKKPIIKDQFLKSMYELEDEYIDIVDYVQNLRVKEYCYSESLGDSLIQDIVEGYCLVETIIEIKSDQSSYEHGFDYDSSSNTITFEKEYYVIVEWTQNFDSKNKKDDFEKIRKYRIRDPSKYSYIILSGECGYRLIIIHRVA